MSETITWNNAHGFDCSSCGHTQEPCEHWKLFVNAQASAAPQATGGLRDETRLLAYLQEAISELRKQDGVMLCSSVAGLLMNILARVSSQTEQPGPKLKCSCRPIHSTECVFRDVRSSQYRNFYASELGRGPAPADAAPAGLGEALKGGDGSYNP